MIPVRRYLSVPDLTEAAAGAVLRPVFLAGFSAQLVVAALVALLVRMLAAGVTPRPNPLLTWILVGFGVVELVIAAALSTRLGSVKDRRAALTTTLITASLYGSISWFLALALATEQRGLPLYLLLLLLSAGYALGFVGVQRLAKAAAGSAPARQKAESD